MLYLIEQYSALLAVTFLVGIAVGWWTTTPPRRS